jgi:hypothetical protein
VANEPATVAGGNRAREAEELARGHVAEDRARAAELLERLHRLAGSDLAVERAEVRAERIGDPLRPATGERPAHSVRQRAEDQSEATGRRCLER